MCSCFIEFIKRVGERNKMRGLPSNLPLFRTEFQQHKSTNDKIYKFYLSFDIRITLKSHFCRINVIILSLCTNVEH